MGKKLTEVKRKHPHRITYRRRTPKPREKQKEQSKSIFDI